ncbi:Retrieval of early ER protein Rer1 [Carpediemonas membranifera]|uniref:Retrieval of early ER protein Rer1 n=1 Tax=Carpediemonas membranifera TaxID=201153 RepID=A0A8J6E7X9_9EUKA|nr:Retrieval of early ER protein Rer1 [Carpediemonas membranifera]|eukprot:KAG9391195.1 Retrieval of early ER protein Rer1 [Carpediemonas membranifera]
MNSPQGRVEGREEAEDQVQIDLNENLSPEPAKVTTFVPPQPEASEPTPASDMPVPMAPMAFPSDNSDPKERMSLRDQLHAETLPDLVRSLSEEAVATYRQVMAMSLPMKKERWLVAAALSAIFFLRVLIARKWVFIAYCLSIYLLSRLLLFVTPNVDPEDSPSNSLPTYENDEYRPFVSRLSEFRFWQRYIEAQIVALFLTLTTLTNIPVVWQMLVIYFVLLAGFSLTREISRMRRFKYAPDIPFLRKLVGIASKPQFSK